MALDMHCLDRRRDSNPRHLHRPYVRARHGAVPAQWRHATSRHNAKTRPPNRHCAVHFFRFLFARDNHLFDVIFYFAVRP